VYRTIHRTALLLGPQPVQAPGCPPILSFGASRVSTLPQAIVDEIIGVATTTNLTRAEISKRFPGFSRSAICGLLFRRGVKAAPRVRKPPAPRTPRSTVRKRRAIPIATVAPQTIAVPLLEVVGCRWEVTGPYCERHFLLAHRPDPKQRRQSFVLAPWSSRHETRSPVSTR
jgi:hypothetical protein